MSSVFAWVFKRRQRKKGIKKNQKKIESKHFKCMRINKNTFVYRFWKSGRVGWACKNAFATKRKWMWRRDIKTIKAKRTVVYRSACVRVMPTLVLSAFLYMSVFLYRLVCLSICDDEVIVCKCQNERACLRDCKIMPLFKDVHVFSCIQGRQVVHNNDIVLNEEGMF